MTQTDPFEISTILVPVDFSAGSELALDAALGIAERTGAAVEVLHVWEPPRFIRPDLMVWMETDGGAQSLAEYSQRRAKEDLDALVAKLDEAHDGVSIEPRAAMGSAASVILDTAEERSPDLIVMGTHGRTGLSHLFLGSVAEKVVRRASVPVMTVPMRQSKNEQKAS